MKESVWIIAFVWFWRLILLECVIGYFNLIWICSYGFFSYNRFKGFKKRLKALTLTVNFLCTFSSYFLLIWFSYISYLGLSLLINVLEPFFFNFDSFFSIIPVYLSEFSLSLPIEYSLDAKSTINSDGLDIFEFMDTLCSNLIMAALCLVNYF